VAQRRQAATEEGRETLHVASLKDQEDRCRAEGGQSRLGSRPGRGGERAIRHTCISLQEARKTTVDDKEVWRVVRKGWAAVLEDTADTSGGLLSRARTACRPSRAATASASDGTRRSVSTSDTSDSL